MFADVIYRLLGVIVLILVLSRLSDWIVVHLQGIGLLLSRSHQVATFFMFIVLAPGILFHELSHWAMARLLGARTAGFRVWPRRTGRQKIQLGAVQVRGAGRLSMALIGLAPFLVGTLALIFLGGWWQTPTAGMADWRAWLSPRGWERVGAFFAQGDWPWRFYALWVVANSMMPSAADREPVRPILIGVVLIAGVAYFVGLIPAIPPGVYQALIDLLDLLAAAFLLAVVGNVGVALLIGLFEYLLGLLLGTRVHYGG